MAATHEVEHFRHVINNLESCIDVAKRLRRIKSRYLDTVTKIEVDLAITSSEDVLHTIDRTIETCRSDSCMKAVGNVKHRRDWLLRSHAPPVNSGPTPASCLQCLTTHIERMNMIQSPPAFTPPIDNGRAHMSPPQLPGYRDSLAPETQGLRAPSLRKLRSRQSVYKTGKTTSMASTSTLSFATEKEVDFTNNQMFDDTSSSYSYDNRATSSSSCAGRSSISSFSSRDMSCTGIYCTLEYCGNHGGAGAVEDDDDNVDGLPEVHSLNLDPGYSDKILILSPPRVTELWNNAPLRAPARRKKGRSGFI